MELNISIQNLDLVIEKLNQIKKLLQEINEIELQVISDSNSNNISNIEENNQFTDEFSVKVKKD